MESSILYRIYFENLRPIQSKTIISSLLESCTVYQAVGWWKGHAENTTVVEVITFEEEKVLKLAEFLRKVNNQESVLVTKIACEHRFV